MQERKPKYVSMSFHKSKVLCRLEHLIRDGRKVLVFDCKDPELLDLLRKGLASKNNAGVEIWQSMEDGSDHVSQSDIDEILEIYRMYDFSDRFDVISDADQYGSMFHYVRNGILSEEEMVEALLEKR